MRTSKAESFIWVILLVLICFRPFICEDAFLAVGMWYVFILTFFSLIYLLLFGKRILLPLRLNIWPALFIVMVLFSMVCAGSTPWSTVKLLVFIPNILIFYITSKIKPYQRRQLLVSIFFMASIICIYAIYQYVIVFRHILGYLSYAEQNSLGKILIDKRTFATFISPNIFASYVVMMLFVGIGLLSLTKAREKIIYWIGIAAMGLSLLYTKSLGGLLAFASSFFLFIRYSFLRFSLRKARIFWIGLSTVFILCILILIYRFLLFDRLSQSFDLHNPNNSMVQRLYYWKASIGMIKDFPFTGIGWCRFGVLYDFYRPLPANISYYSHNVFLQILVETGPPGLISFLLIVVTFLRNGLTVINKNSTEDRALKIGLFCAGCSFLIHNLIDLSFYFGQVAFFWWIIIGLFSNFRVEITKK